MKLKWKVHSDMHEKMWARFNTKTIFLEESTQTDRTSHYQSFQMAQEDRERPDMGRVLVFSPYDQLLHNGYGGFGGTMNQSGNVVDCHTYMQINTLTELRDSRWLATRTT